MLGHNPESYDFISKIPRIIISFSSFKCGDNLGIEIKVLRIVSKENVNCGPSASADYYLGPQCDHVFFDPARFHFFFLLRSPILFFSLMWAIICKRKRMTRSLDPFLDDSFRLAICWWLVKEGFSWPMRSIITMITWSHVWQARRRNENKRFTTLHQESITSVSMFSWKRLRDGWIPVKIRNVFSFISFPFKRKRCLMEIFDLFFKNWP